MAFRSSVLMSLPVWTYVKYCVKFCGIWFIGPCLWCVLYCSCSSLSFESFSFVSGSSQNNTLDRGLQQVGGVDSESDKKGLKIIGRFEGIYYRTNQEEVEYDGNNSLNDVSFVLDFYLKQSMSQKFSISIEHSIKSANVNRNVVFDISLREYEKIFESEDRFECKKCFIGSSSLINDKVDWKKELQKEEKESGVKFSVDAISFIGDDGEQLRQVTINYADESILSSAMTDFVLTFEKEDLILAKASEQIYDSFSKEKDGLLLVNKKGDDLGRVISKKEISMLLLDSSESRFLEILKDQRMGSSIETIDSIEANIELDPDGRFNSNSDSNLNNNSSNGDGNVVF